MLFYFADGGSILDVKDEFVPMNMNKRSGLIGLGSDWSMDFERMDDFNLIGIF